MSIKTVLASLVLISGLLGAQTAVDSFFDHVDEFLGAVVANGEVDYAGLSEQRALLDDLVQVIAAMPADQLAEEALVEQAFWINAYNILVINAVSEAYPIRSPRDIGGFFDTRHHTVAGAALTLDELEHDRLFKKYDDPRFHFVLVCAAGGCPQIIAAAYRPASLGTQMDQRARRTLNDSGYVYLDQNQGKVHLSRIFDWYEDDFARDRKSVIDYVNAYRIEQIPADYKVEYIAYDWGLNDRGARAATGAPGENSNLQAYTPSTLLREGQVEIKIFNNLYTQTAFFDDQNSKVEQGGRSTFFTGIGNVLVGLNPRLNIGIDFYLKAVRNDDVSSSPFAALRFGDGPNERSGLSAIGPKIKIAPLTSNPNIALQFSFLIPTMSDLEGKESNGPYLDNDDLQWWTQIFYDRQIKRNMLIYLEAGFIARFGVDNNDFLTPVKAILNYYPSRRWTVYLPTEWGPAWGGDGLNSYYTQYGLGLKYQVTPGLEIESLLTQFPLGRNNGAGLTYNLGLRWVH